MVNQFRQSERGFTIMEIAISVGIMGLLTGAITVVLGFASTKMQKARVHGTRDRLIESIVRIAGMPSAIRASVAVDPSLEPFNLYLSNCVGHSWTMPCIHKNIGNGNGNAYGQVSQTSNGNNGNGNGNGNGNNNQSSYTPFRLYMASMSNVVINGETKFKLSGAITGTPAYPMRYSATGSPCDTLSSTCPTTDYPLEVYTEFMPYCPTYAQGRARNWNVSDTDLQYPTRWTYYNSCWAGMYVQVRVTIQSSKTPAEFKKYQKTVIVGEAEVLGRW